MDRAIVSIVGRPNVGKSTFFNRAVGRKVAIVDDIPGITRDRNYAEIQWGSHHFYLVDTGGLVPDTADRIQKAIGEQVRVAISEADLVIFLVDGREGVSPLDGDIADLLRRSGKEVMLVVNKVDSEADEIKSYEFSKLGMGKMWAISSNQGRNMGELLDDLVERLPHRPEARETSTGIRVAIVGRPNVGKSSLVNAIVGADRVIVDEVPGTTRDSVDTPFSFEGHHFVLIDTAGMRRKARVKGRVEFYSNLRALRSIERCQVGVLVVDAAGGIAEQDARIGSGLEGMSKGVIIVLNKIDLVPPEKLSTIEAEVQRELSFLDYAPLGRVSALKGEGIRPLLRKVIEVRDIMQKKVLDEEAEAVLEDALKRNPAPSTRRGRAQTFYSAVQKGGRGGTFVIACTDPESIPESYIRYLRNRFRSAFGFAGVGVRVVLRRGGKRG